MKTALRSPQHTIRQHITLIDVASDGDKSAATMQVAASIYSFLTPSEAKDEIGRLGDCHIKKLHPSSNKPKYETRCVFVASQVTVK